ncbi:MAG: UDP-N-acetylmuramoyl-L-alanine--D-glutamate ligase [Alphaproteobacteria bacterium]
MSTLATLTPKTRVALWGYGREGRATRRFLEARVPGLVPTLVTDAPAEPEGLPQLTGDAGRSALATGSFDVVVKSPGISLYRDEVAAARAAGSVVTSGTNLWFETRPTRFVLAVTGTKGKSTTASLIAHLWRGAEPRVALAGNVGAPLLALEPAGAPLVLELSSYQIADLAYGPPLMVLTNLYPEHLDWHRGHERYFADKLRLVDLAGTAVLNAADARTAARLAERRRARWYGTAAGWHVTDDAVRRGEDVVFRADDWPLKGTHNLWNLAAALAALEAAGLDGRALAPRAASFTGLGHRLEILGEREGVTWVNDSISTTPESAAAAVRAFADRPLTLLLGGQDRGQDPAPLADALRGRNARIVALPDNGPALAAGLAVTDSRHAFDLDAAVALARAITPTGGVVLLSPAAPSYGRFRNFEERGERFAALAGFTRAQT